MKKIVATFRKGPPSSVIHRASKPRKHLRRTRAQRQLKINARTKKAAPYCEAKGIR
jgi:hypothetical protein